MPDSESVISVKNGHYDLERRTFDFARRTASFLSSLPKSVTNIEYGKQCVRSSASIGANYIEANESFSRKDFVFRIKICRKEAKETLYWLKLIAAMGYEEHKELTELMGEADELRRILSAIITRSAGAVSE